MFDYLITVYFLEEGNFNQYGESRSIVPEERDTGKILEAINSMTEKGFITLMDVNGAIHYFPADVVAYIKVEPLEGDSVYE